MNAQERKELTVNIAEIRKIPKLNSFSELKAYASKVLILKGNS